MGTLSCPPDIYLSFAAWFTIWSIASTAKLMVIISTTGLSPSIAAPVPIPARTSSEIGRVPHARLAELLEQPLGHPVSSLILRHFLAYEEDVLITPHLLAKGMVKSLSVIY